jgi:hypothetical protein
LDEGTEGAAHTECDRIVKRLLETVVVEKNA